VILSERREFLSLGHEVINGDPIKFAKRTARSLKGQIRALPPGDVTWAIEVNDFPKKIKKRNGIQSFRLCRWMEGRLLQALEIPNPLEIQASPEAKELRRKHMELKYADQLAGHGLWYTASREIQGKCLGQRGHLSRLIEDEIDALAVADAACEKLLLDKVKSRA
jgi:hypothetical protein